MPCDILTNRTLAATQGAELGTAPRPARDSNFCTRYDRVLPASAGTAVLLNGNGLHAWGEVVSAQDPVEVVDLMGHEPRDPPLEDGDATVAIDVLMLDVDDERAVDEAADVEEAETSLVLLVGLIAGLDDARVELRDHIGGAGRAHDSRCAFDADLGCGVPMPLPKVWTAATRWVAECSSEMTRRASSASTGKENSRAGRRRTRSPSWTMLSALMVSLGFGSASGLACSSSRKCHSSRYRAWSGGSSVDQE